jgi:hypothetical protein
MAKGEQNQDFENMRVDELRKVAQERNISHNWDMNKQELIDALKNS